ncbi:MAG: RagB/SusD family nutrient uptake outer membrane protein, partial [Bacteroidales bacterium]
DKHIIGEALFLKAYAMHELVRLYAKPYTQSNPTTDLGIILRESSTDTDNKDRATLQDTYDYIVKCLLEAETIMDGVTSTRDDAKGFASIWAVRAELSRVYLYMGNWEKAKEYASKVINSNKFKLETTSDIPGYVADAENASETVWCITMIAADDKESASVASMIMTEGDGCWGEEGYSPSLLEAMGMGTNDEEADVRFKFVQDPAIKNGLTLYPCSKYSWQNGKKTCASPILIRYAEMYFNRAEAEANLGDATSALADINAVREQRIDPSAVAGTTMSDYLYKASDITSSTTALDLVMKEKRIEFCFECQRFFDLMRYGKDIVRNYWGFHILTYAAGQSTSSLPGLNVDQVVTKATYPKLIYP